jgi:hypothetical protein
MLHVLENFPSEQRIFTGKRNGPLIRHGPLKEEFSKETKPLPSRLKSDTCLWNRFAVNLSLMDKSSNILDTLYFWQTDPPSARLLCGRPAYDVEKNFREGGNIRMGVK